MMSEEKKEQQPAENQPKIKEAAEAEDIKKTDAQTAHKVEEAEEKPQQKEAAPEAEAKEENNGPQPAEPQAAAEPPRPQEAKPAAAPEAKEQKKKKINNMTLRELDEKIKATEAKMGNLNSKFAQSLKAQRQRLSKEG